MRSGRAESVEDCADALAQGIIASIAVVESRQSLSMVCCHASLLQDTVAKVQRRFGGTRSGGARRAGDRCRHYRAARERNRGRDLTHLFRERSPQTVRSSQKKHLRKNLSAICPIAWSSQNSRQSQRIIPRIKSPYQLLARNRCDIQCGPMSVMKANVRPAPNSRTAKREGGEDRNIRRRQ